MKVRFKQRLKYQFRGHLRDPVGHRRNSQRANASAFLWYFDSADRLWVVATRGHPIPQLVQIVLQTFLKALRSFVRRSLPPHRYS